MKKSDTASAAPAAKPRATATPTTIAGDRLVPCREVLSMFACGRTWLYEELKAERFPPPIKRGRRSLWLASKLNAHLQTVGQASQA